MSTKSHSIIIKGYYKLFSQDITRFIAVGLAGFVVNYIGLAILYHLIRLPILIAQIIGAETALLATFFGNNFWAFRGHEHSPFKVKLLKFHGTAGMGIVINSTCVVLLVHYAHLFYGLALVVGSLAALIWNYTLNKKFVFKTIKLEEKL